MSPGALNDLKAMICNHEIGRGVARIVYTTEVFPGCVVKVEDSAQSFQNVIEWHTWNRVKDHPDLAPWFAPCKWISPSGIVLVMEKTEAVPEKRFPRKMPVYLTDFKRTNYGLYKNRVVCHDYGTHLMMDTGMSSRLKVVEWWDA